MRNLLLLILVSFTLLTRPAYSKTYPNKPISADSVFEQQKNWIIKWFSDRKIENPKYNRKYNSIRFDVLNRLKNTNLVQVESKDIEGIAEWKEDTIYYTPAVIKYPEYNSVFAHELGHDAFPVIRSFDGNIKNDMERWMIKLITESISNSDNGSFYRYYLSKKYYHQPEEIYARICAFRFACKLEPNQNLSLSDLAILSSKIQSREIDDDNSKDLLMLVDDPRELLKLLNNLP